MPTVAASDVFTGLASPHLLRPSSNRNTLAIGATSAPTCPRYPQSDTAHIDCAVIKVPTVGCNRTIRPAMSRQPRIHGTLFCIIDRVNWTNWRACDTNKQNGPKCAKVVAPGKLTNICGVQFEMNHLVPLTELSKLGQLLELHFVNERSKLSITNCCIEIALGKLG